MSPPPGEDRTSAAPASEGGERHEGGEAAPGEEGTGSRASEPASRAAEGEAGAPEPEQRSPDDEARTRGAPEKGAPPPGEAPASPPASRGALGAPPIGPHLWQIRAVRDAAVVAVLLAGLGFALEILQAVLPVLIGFLGAYLVAPLVRWLEARGIRRWLIVLATSLASTAALAGALAFVLPRLLDELKKLRERFPQYLEVIQTQTGLEVGDLLEALDLTSALGALDSMQPLLGVVGSLVGTTASGLVFVVLLLVAFTVFNLEFERLPLLTAYLPRSRRQQLEPMAEVVVEVFRGYLRGQLLVMMFTGTVYTLGFWFLGVPFGVFAGLVGGVLSIIPYGQLSGPLLAVVFNLLESQVATGPLDPMRVIVLPAVVYAVMQSLESFVVTPLVQGAATRLHPLAILACLAAGGSIGGVLGVFLAIPLTAAGWIIARERVLPAWRAWAEAA